jgi:phosphatidylserine/phosphatidylglycerophosphate/cardiolipin synthase-like enzyme
MHYIEANIIPVLSTDYPKIVVPLLQAAGHKIDVIMYEWKWYSHESAGGVEKFNLAFQTAARKGVKIRALLNIESMGHAITKINSRTAQYLTMAGIEVKFGQLGTTTHAKMIIIDDRIMILGSHNISKGSFSRNQEASIVIEGGDAVRQYINYFNLLWDHL